MSGTQGALKGGSRGDPDTIKRPVGRNQPQSRGQSDAINRNQEARRTQSTAIKRPVGRNQPQSRGSQARARMQSTAINRLSGASGGHILDHKVGGQLKGRCGILALRRECLI